MKNLAGGQAAGPRTASGPALPDQCSQVRKNRSRFSFLQWEMGIHAASAGAGKEPPIRSCILSTYQLGRIRARLFFVDLLYFVVLTHGSVFRDFRTGKQQGTKAFDPS